MKPPATQKGISRTRLSQRLRRVHIENLGLKLSALALALLLFALSRQPIIDIRLSGVPLEFRGQSPNVVISGDVEQTVSVRLSGPRDIMRSLTPNQISVIADLTNKEPGERVVQLRPEDVSRPDDDNIQVLQVEPASIKLRLEPKVLKRVKVEPQFMGQVDEGLEVYKVTAEPSTVEIEGPDSQVNKTNLVLTETINLIGRNNDFRIAVDVETPHNSLRVKTPGPVILSVEVGERRVTRTIAKVPIEWPNQQSGVRLLPKTIDVELYGPKSALAALQVSDLRVGLKLNDLPPDIETVRPQVILPASADKHIEVKNIIPAEVRLKRQ
jgi:YbbR domain-containing protein